MIPCELASLFVDSTQVETFVNELRSFQQILVADCIAHTNQGTFHMVTSRRAGLYRVPVDTVTYCKFTVQDCKGIPGLGFCFACLIIFFFHFSQ